MSPKSEANFRWHNYSNDLDPCPRPFVGNVAYGKPAFQSGAFDYLTADLAVDGRLWEEGTAWHGNHYCAHPDIRDGSPGQWTLDLEGNYQLYNITVYNREDGGGEISALENFNCHIIIRLG